MFRTTKVSKNCICTIVATYFLKNYLAVVFDNGAWEMVATYNLTKGFIGRTGNSEQARSICLLLRQQELQFFLIKIQCLNFFDNICGQPGFFLLKEQYLFFDGVFGYEL